MSGMGSNTYFESVVKEVKNKIEDYIKFHGREVASNGSFRCLMPSGHTHGDDDWSAHVTPKNGIKVWYCQVCKLGGTTFDLAHFVEGLPIHGEGFKRTVLELANKLNIPIDISLFPATNDSAQEFNVHSMLDMYREVENYLCTKGNGVKHLVGGEFGRTYTEDLAKKACDLVPMGVVVSEELTKHMIDRFGDRTKSLPFYDDKSALLAPYVFNVNRLVITTRDRLGRPISFSGRAKEITCSKDLPKELRVAKYIHTKGFESLKRSTLFMLDQAKGAIKDTHVAKLVEGQFDTIAMHLSGSPNTVGLLGSNISEEAIDLLLAPYSVYTLVEIVDNDKAGVAAVRRSLDILKNYDVVVQAAALPVGEDPDSIFRSGDLSPLTNTMDALEFVLRNDQAFHDKTKPADTRFKEAIGFVVSICPFTVKYREYATIIGEYFGYHTDDILTSMTMFRNSDSKIVREENRIMDRVYDAKILPIQDKIMVVERSLEDLKSLSASSRPTQRRTTWQDFMDLTTGQRKFPRVLDTGLSALDRHADIEIGSLTFMGGYPSNGKSSVLQFLALELLKMHQDLKVLYISTDDIPEKPMASMIAIMTGLSKKVVRTMITEGTIMNQAAFSARMDEIHSIFADRLTLKGIADCNSVPTIRSELEDMAAHHSGPILTVVDAMNDLKEMSVQDQRVGLENIIRDFKGMAPTYNSAIITVSHLTKQSQNDFSPAGNKRPRLRDLKGSSFIEFAAKTIFFVYMDMHYDTDTELKWRAQGITGGNDYPVVEVETAKDKDNKAAERAFLHFDPVVGTFTEPSSGLVSNYEALVRDAINNTKKGAISKPSSGIGDDFF